MSCTTNNKPYFKIGDSFDVPIQMIDTLTGDAVEITAGMTFTSNIVNLTGEVIASPTITPYPNQITDKGFLLLSVPPTTTINWEVGKVKMDIKLVVDGSVRHSQDFSFNIIEAITP